jgi:hypothetical protein
VDIGLAAIALEGIALLAVRLSGRRHIPSDIFLNLASGGLLMLGLRVAIVGGPIHVIMALMTAAGAAHALALRSRWRALRA